jgi:LytTr DNA-binding domain
MASSGSKIRVLIVSECEAHLDSVRELVLSRSDLEVVGVCSQIGGLPQAVATSEADLVFWASPNEKSKADKSDLYGGFQLLVMPVAHCLPHPVPDRRFPSGQVIGERCGADAAAGEDVSLRQNEVRSGQQIDQAIDQMKRFLSFESSSSIFSELESKAVLRDRLCIKSRGRILFLAVADIRWIEGAGNYLRIHLDSESHMVRETISDFEARLDPARFVRIHRSVIVNLDAIREMRPWPTGEYVVTLKDGKELTLSRSYRSCIVRLISNDPSTASPLSSTLHQSPPPPSSLSRVIKQGPGRATPTARIYGN